MKRAPLLLFAALLLSFAAAQSTSETLSKELVLRLFSNPDYPEGDVTDILVGELPDALPPEISLPQGAEVVATLLYGGERAQIVLETERSPDEVFNLYKMELRGWREAYLPRREGGFIENEADQPISFCNDEADMDLWVGTFERETSTEVRLSFSEIDTHSICNEEEGMRFRGDAVPVPTLTTPAGARLSGSGSGSDEDGVMVRGNLETSLSPQDLISAYAEQLPEQGWQLGVRSGDRTQAWHAFTLSNEEGDWRGYLVAIALPEKRAQLFFSVAPEVSKDE